MSTFTGHNIAAHIAFPLSISLLHHNLLCSLIGIIWRSCSESVLWNLSFDIEACEQASFAQAMIYLEEFYSDGQPHPFANNWWSFFVYYWSVIWHNFEDRILILTSNTCVLGWFKIRILLRFEVAIQFSSVEDNSVYGTMWRRNGANTVDAFHQLL